MSLKQTLENSFETYAGMTIMDRAICDARDCLKPGARMSMYAQYLEKLLPINLIVKRRSQLRQLWTTSMYMVICHCIHFQQDLVSHLL